MADTSNWYSPETSTFGDRLAAARGAAGLTQKDLAKRLGIKLSTMRSWEDDWSEPRANKLQMMAGLLNVSFTWLLNGEGDGVADPSELDQAPGNTAGILTEIRDVRSQMVRLNERLGLLEKRLRVALQEEST